MTAPTIDYAPAPAERRATLASKLLKFGGVSGLSFVVNVGGSWLLYGPLGVHPEVAYALSLVAVFAMNFWLMRRWVFRPGAGEAVRSGRRQMAEYAASSVAFRAAEYASFLGLHTGFGWNPTLAIIAISCVATAAKFLVFNGRVFASRSAEPEAVPDAVPNVAETTAGDPRPFPWGRWLPVVIAVILAFLGTVWRFVGAVLRDHAFDGDLAQHVYWGQRAWGADLLAHDPLARHYASDVASPLLWKGVVAVMGRLGEIQLVADLAATSLFVATCWLLYRLCKGIGGGSPWAGVWGVFAATLFIGTSKWIPQSLLQRSFAVPLTALAVLALHERRMWLLGLCYLFSGLLYPITIVSIGALGVAHESWRLWQDRRLPRGWWMAVIGGVAGLALILVVRDPPDLYGPSVTYEQARSMEVFGPTGRNAIWLDDAQAFWFDHHRTGLRIELEDFLKGAAALAVVALLAGWREIRRVPPVAWMLGLTGLALFFIAHATLFALYLPNRHVWITLPLSWTLLMAALSVAAGRRAAGWLRIERPAWPWVAAGAWAIVVTGWVGEAEAVLRNRAEVSAERLAVEYARSTPPDTLFAGLPVDAEVDEFPLRTGRPILINYETAQAYYPKFYDAVVVPRLRASVEMYYATDWETIDRIGQEWGVDAFLWRAHALKELPPHEPMRSMAVEAIRRATADGDDVPAMYEPPADRILWWAGDVRLVRVGDGPAAATPPGPVEPFPDLPPVSLRALLP